MISVLLANAKGGCGKTTIATNLATAFANAGLTTALADTDRQQSCKAWFRHRPSDAAPIHLLDWRKDIGKPPRGTDRLVIDTGAGLRSRRVRTLLKRSDLLIMPVLPSLFDERATRRFLKAVDELKPIRKGRKPVAIVGNRLRPGSRTKQELDAFLAGLGHDVITGFRDRTIYQDIARRGLGIFDLPPSRRRGVVDDWLPLIRLIESLG